MCRRAQRQAAQRACFCAVAQVGRDLREEAWLATGRADIPQPGERIGRGNPVCTVFARALDRDPDLATMVQRVIFLGGFRSDMSGTKAVYLEDWAKARGRAYLRFDYRGHGKSSGAFEEGSIGDWADDAAEVLGRLTQGPQVLVGSSMGGWIALLLARERPERAVRAGPGSTAGSMDNRFGFLA